MSFGEALEKLKKSARVRRSEWEEGTYVYLEDMYRRVVAKGGGMEHTRLYTAVFIRYHGGFIHEVGWHPTTADILADDWQEVLD